MKRIIITLVALFISVVVLDAKIILIPEDYLTIQEGINEADNGDTVLVNIGTYFENINYNGKNIVVGSLFLITHDPSYIEQTVIDGNEAGSVVTFSNGEDDTAVLCGFTIKNGSGTIVEIFVPQLAGGGIFIAGYSNATINNCIIMNNTADIGSGIFIYDNCNSTISNCIIDDNTASSGGGIAFYEFSGGDIHNSTIKNNWVNNCGGGIECWYYSYPSFEDCSIIYNSASKGGGVCCRNCPEYYEGKPIFTSCSIAHNISTSSLNVGGGGVYCFDSNSEFNDCQICYNTTTSVYGGGLCVEGSNSRIKLFHCIISNNNGGGCNLQNNGVLLLTLCNVINNTGGGLYIGGEACTERGASINSCIIWANEPHQVYLDGPSSYINFGWSDLQDGEDGIINNGGTIHWMVGNIDEYPLFVEEGNHLYHLLEGSPCIDAGSEFLTDPDGTRADMGCYPTVYDVKKIKNIWNWVSFPRLERDGNEPVAADSVLMNIEPFPTELELKGFGNVNMGYYEGDWYYNGLYDIQSTFGYKLETSNTENSYLPLYGSRVAPYTPMTLYEGRENWIGYFLPQTQDIDDAFGEYFDNVISIRAENWYYDSGPSRHRIRPLHYGKGYIVTVDSTITNFTWSGPTGIATSEDPKEPQFFSFEDGPDYEVIDVIDLDETILEIGVFEDDICVGAAVVDSGCAQILAYTGYANRDGVELTFQVVYGRGTKIVISNYSVYDFTTGEYVEKKLIAGMQEYSIVRLSTGGGITLPTRVSLSQNSPNPFGFSTTISYALPEESVVEISIYNIRGQRVKAFEKGKVSAGNHSVIWNGKDDNSKRLGNGIYFCKLSAGKKRIIKKMLLMR